VTFETDAPPHIEDRVADDEDLDTAIAAAIATDKGVDVTELPPLWRTVDAECLADLFHSDQDEGMVVFPYAGYRVTVHADRRIRIEPSG
jgi:hypothetical protein